MNETYTDCGCKYELEHLQLIKAVHTNYSGGHYIPEHTFPEIVIFQFGPYFFTFYSYGVAHISQC